MTSDQDCDWLNFVSNHFKDIGNKWTYCTLSLHVLGQLLFSWTSHDSSEQQMVPHLPLKIDTCKQLLKVLLQHDIDA